MAFGDRTAANNTTAVYSQTLNSAMRRIKGWDFEVGYAFDWHGRWNARVLANYQPTDEQQLFTGAPVTIPGSLPVGSLIAKTHVTLYLSYESDGWAICLQNRWHSRIDKRITNDPIIPQNYVHPCPSSANYLDINIQKELDIGGTEVTPYLKVQNLFNAKGEVYSTSVVQGIHYPVSQDDEVMAASSRSAFASECDRCSSDEGAPGHCSGAFFMPCAGAISRRASGDKSP